MDTPEHLGKRLQEDGDRTLAFFQGLPDDAWGRLITTGETGWTVLQVLAHLVAAERSLARLVANILDGGPGTPDNFDLDAYNARKVAELRSRSPEELARLFRRLRVETADLVAKMQPEDLARTGRHPYLGVASLGEIIKLIYRHNQIHIREVRKILLI